jgi:hypothetical protein
VDPVIMQQDTSGTGASVYLPVVQDGRKSQAALNARKNTVQAQRGSLGRDLFLPAIVR